MLNIILASVMMLIHFLKQRCTSGTQLLVAQVSRYAGPLQDKALEELVSTKEGYHPSRHTSCPHPGHGAAFLDKDHLSTAESSSARYASPLSAGWSHNTSGHVMSGAVSERSHSVPGMVDDKTMSSEEYMDDSFLGHLTSLFDEFEEMRLEIDNMGYEERIARRERMGDFWTGLAGEMISKCLKVAKYDFISKQGGKLCYMS